MEILFWSILNYSGRSQRHINFDVSNCKLNYVIIGTFNLATNLTISVSCFVNVTTELVKHLNVSIYGECNGQPLKNPLDVGWDFTFSMIG
jgi:hypothetical protein